MSFRTNVSMKKRYTKELTGMLGVDMSSAPHAVSPARASEMRNLIPENGVNHKRHGWHELFKGEEKINGIFPFDEGGTEVLLVHAGTALYRAVESEGVWSKKMVSGDITLTDMRSQCFYQNGMAFLVGCGTYLVYGIYGGRYVLKPVRDVAYVPLTTRNCSPVTFENGICSTDETRFSYENVNRLGYWRRNSCMIPNYKENTTLHYRLDSYAASGSEITITIRAASGSLVWEGNGSVQYYNAPGCRIEWFSDCYAHIIANEYNSTQFHLLKIDLPSSKSALLSGGEITVKFRTKILNEYEIPYDPIERMRFGTLFGVDGASDRLFLSGNPNEKNKDYFSEAGDFTYFPDGNVLTVGDSASAVTGYARLSDATLAIFKGEAMGRPAIFYRTGKEITVKDYDGQDMPAPLFPTLPGTASEYLLNAHAVAGLSGDVLMLSRNGVFGIELSDNIASSERYARERSYAIYGDLKKRDLSNAACTVFRNRYYLALGDEEGICYVADNRYRATFAASRDTGYEWWVWDHVPARCFAIYQGNLLFGTADGRVCAFDEGYCDRSFTEIAEGAATLTEDGLIFNCELGVEKGDRVTFESDLYAVVLEGEMTAVDTFSYKVEDTARLLRLVGIGDAVEIAHQEENGNEVLETARVVDIDPGALQIVFENGLWEHEQYPVPGKILICLRGKECTVGDSMTVNGVTYRTLLSKAGDTLPLWFVDNQNVVGRLTHYRPVVASWCSPVLDLGSNMHAKTLLGITTALDPSAEGELSVFYETRRDASSFVARTPVLLDFDALDFDAFSFYAQRFSNSYTKRLAARNFNYIRVGYRAAGEGDCAVTGLSLYYKINQMNKGVF